MERPDAIAGSRPNVMQDLSWSVVQTSADGPIVVEVAGEIDASNASGLRSALLTADITADAQSTVLVRLDELSFIDSAGLRALEDAVAEIERRGGVVRLVAAPQAVCRRLFEIAAPGLLLFASVAEATVDVG